MVRGLTLRSCLLGVIGVLIVNIGAPYSKYILHSSLLACDYLPLGVVFPFFIMVAVLNPCVKLVRREWALRSEELVIAFIISLIGSTIPTFGLTGYLISTIAAPYYFASAENQWREILHPYLPEWLLPSNVNLAMTEFFEGLRDPGRGIPWAEWAVPLAWWMTFAGAVFILSFCLMVVLRKQWVEKERLVFPLAEVPLEMVRGAEQRRLLPAFMNGVFWLGFLVPLVICLWNMISYFKPGFPTILALRWRALRLGRGFPSIRTNLYFPIIGYAYLVNLDVSLSVWLFHLLAVLQAGVLNRIGYPVGTPDTYCSWIGGKVMSWMCFGAFTVFVLSGLWVARSHFHDVLREAFSSKGSLKDEDELISYRGAVLGGLI